MNEAQRRRELIDRLFAAGIACGAPTPIDMEPEETNMMHTRRTLTAAPAAPSPDDAKKITAIAAVFGLDPTDLAGLAAACQALLGDASAAELAARRQLTASELRALSATPGATALGYLSAKRAVRGTR